MESLSSGNLVKKPSQVRGQAGEKWGTLSKAVEKLGHAGFLFVFKKRNNLYLWELLENTTDR